MNARWAWPIPIFRTPFLLLLCVVRHFTFSTWIEMRRFFILLLNFFVVVFCTHLANLDDNPIDDILKESLRSNRVQACDGERITLSCPRNTQIAVQAGFYGRVVSESELCPPQAPKASDADGILDTKTCDVIQANTRISELCDKRRKCHIFIDATTFDDDHCPTTSKYLQMTYGCIPVAFEEKVFCSEEPNVKLECKNGQRLAVYSAQIKASRQCSKDDIFDDCVSDVLPQVLRQCHAQQACLLDVDSINGFCRQGHLHVVSMCVNEEIFSEEAIKGELASLETYFKQMSPIEQKEPIPEDVEKSIVHQIANDGSYLTRDDEPQDYDDDEQTPLPVAEKIEPKFIGIAHDVLQLLKVVVDHKEKLVLFLILAVCISAILILLVCILSRLCCSGSKKKERMALATDGSSKYGSSNMQDIEDVHFLRFSSPSIQHSTYSPYDF